MLVGIIGGGFVGSATALIQREDVHVVVYDTDPAKCIPSGLTFDELDKCDLLFVCVPTPMLENGKCYTGIVERVIDQAKTLPSQPFIVIRSTVPVGFCESHSVLFMPEFLTEKNWRNDFLTCSEWIVGLDNEHDKVKSLFEAICLPSVTQLTFTTTKEAEAIKYFRNCFLATKVSFCNEFEAWCNDLGVNYSLVSVVASRDSRIGSSHIRVPGPDGHRGFGGTCFPKDMASLNHQLGERSVLIQAAIQRNTTIDRPEQDWKTSDEFKGRAVVKN